MLSGSNLIIIGIKLYSSMSATKAKTSRLVVLSSGAGRASHVAKVGSW